MIIRRKHTANFTTIGNALFRDERLQADEIGIIGWLLSQPHDWEVRRPALGRRFRYGRDAIKRVLWNAMRHGWIVARKTQLSDGRFHTIYEVRDEPGPELSDTEIRSALSLGSSEAGEPDSEGEGPGQPPETGVPDTGDPPADPPTGQPGVGQPATGNPYVAPKEGATKYGFTKDESTKAGRALEQVTAKWPPDHVLSRVSAETALLALSDKDFADCKIGIEPYLSECKAANRKVCDLTTFVRERRWERFSARARAASANTAIKPGTPEFYRWREYLLAIGESVKVMDTMAKLGRDITVPSQWPPPVPAEAATGPPD